MTTINSDSHINQLPIELIIADESEDHSTNITSDKDSIYNDENCDQLEYSLNNLTEFNNRFNDIYNTNFIEK